MFMTMRYTSYLLFNIALPCDLEIALEITHEHFPRFALYNIIDLMIVKERATE